MSGFAGWYPARAFWTQAGPRIDWRWLGGRRFTEPFFETTMERALLLPFAQLFGRETGVAELEQWAADSPGLPVAGLVFHMSRCGSTLVAQMLGASRENIVLSEPGPLDMLLRGRYRGAPEEDVARWVRALFSAYGQQRDAEERRVVVKLDCWHMRELPVLRRAFPEAPWVFLYRDPVEVLVSQFRQPGAWTLPGMIEPAVVGMEPWQIAAMPREEYCARTLAAIAEAAVRLEDGRGIYVNYRELPAALETRILPHFGLRPDAAERERMQAVAGRNAKTPVMPFASDVAEKQQAATAQVRELAARWLGEWHEALERLQSRGTPAR